MTALTTQIMFYHLSVSPIEKAMPRLLEKIVESGHRIILYLLDQSEIKKYDDILWTFSSRSFLGHAQHGEKFPELQPIILTNEEVNPNGADILVTLSSLEIPHLGSFAKLINIFDGNDEEQTQLARTSYKKYKQDGFDLTYWKQDEKGSWIKG